MRFIDWDDATLCLPDNVPAEILQAVRRALSPRLNGRFTVKGQQSTIYSTCVFFKSFELIATKRSCKVSRIRTLTATIRPFVRLLIPLTSNMSGGCVFRMLWSLSEEK